MNIFAIAFDNKIENNKSLAKLTNFDIIIINYNTCSLTSNCIESILKNGIDENRIIVVDNNSSDNSVGYIAEHYPRVRLVMNDNNYGYAKAINIGVGHSNADYLIISNSDIIYPDNSINFLLDEFMNLPDAGIASPQLLNADGTYQLSHSYFPGIKFGLMELTGFNSLLHTYYSRIFDNKHYIRKKKSVEYCAGAVLIFSRILYRRLNGFSEDYFFYTEETDFCKRALDLGYKNYLIRNVRVYHLNGGTRGKITTPFVKLLVFTKRLFLKQHLSGFEREFYRFTQLVKFGLLYISRRMKGIIFKKDENLIYHINNSRDFFNSWYNNYEVLEKEMGETYGSKNIR